MIETKNLQKAFGDHLVLAGIDPVSYTHLDAKEESVNTILQMAEYKKDGPCQFLIVTGCMAQRYQQEIIDEIPAVSYTHL